MAEELLASMIKRSASAGWAVSDDDPSKRWWRYEGVGTQLNRQARALGLEAVPNRTGDPVVSELRPTSITDARASSLSATVGFGEQPLHTDGAHLRRTPKYVVLWSDEVNATSTRVWNPQAALRSLDRFGVFLVEPGGEQFFTQAVTRGRLRFDPGCMVPVDAYAKRAATVLRTPPADEVVEIHWDVPGKILLLRNHLVLHGRARVAEGDEDRLVSRVAYVRSS